MGDYYRRVLKEQMFPNDPGDDVDHRSAEEKARECGREHVIKPESRLPHDSRPDPYADFLRKPLPAPAFDEPELDIVDPFGARVEANTLSLPTINEVRKKMKVPKTMRKKKPPALTNQLPKFRRPAVRRSRKS